MSPMCKCVQYLLCNTSVKKVKYTKGTYYDEEKH